MPLLENEEQTNRIVEILGKLNAERSVEERYTAPANLNGIPNFCEGVQLGDGSLYEQNVNLKFQLSERFRDENVSDEEKAQLGFWIAKRWGGIKTLGERGENMIRNDINDFFHSNQMNIDCDIPSRSKVLAFLDPNKYAVCDSKTVFAINWLLYFTRCNDNVSVLKQLETRNGVVWDHLFKNYNLNCEFTETDRIYADYMETIRTLSERLGWEIYKTEMLLFTIADDRDSGIIQMIENEEREGHIERR